MSYDVAFLNIKNYKLDISAIGINGNIITAIGSNQEIKEGIDDNTSVIDGENKMVIPGFCDSHTHFATFGVMNTKYINLVNTRSKNEIFHKIENEVQNREKGEWIAGINWDESDWDDGKDFMTRNELDEVAPENPVSLQRIDGHIIIVNSKALEILDLDPKLKGYEIINGKPTGKLMEKARFPVRDITEADVEAYKEGILTAIDTAHSLGVTSIHDIYIDKYRYKAYQELWQENKLNIRVTLYFSNDFLNDFIKMGSNLTLGNNYLRPAGIKIFSDGSIGAKTAWVTSGYSDNKNNIGLPIWEKHELQELINKAHKNDIQVAVHAIGDCAVTNVINCFESTMAEEKKDLQHRIEHMEMVTRDELKKMKELGIAASIQPNFIGKWGQPGGMYEERFDAATYQTMNPLRWIKEENIKMIMGSDCMPFDPFYGIHSTVNAPFSCQQLTVAEAINAYTAGASFSSYIDRKTGEIKEGFLADLILLEEDPFKNPGKIKDIRPELTIFDGKIVYQKKSN